MQSFLQRIIDEPTPENHAALLLQMAKDQSSPEQIARTAEQSIAALCEKIKIEKYLALIPDILAQLPTSERAKITSLVGDLSGGEVLKRTVTVLHAQGLHLRPCSAIVGAIKKFDARVIIKKDGHQINANSMIGLLSLGATHGTELYLHADGPDAKKALEAIAQLFGEQISH